MLQDGFRVTNLKYTHGGNAKASSSIEDINFRGKQSQEYNMWNKRKFKD